MSAIVLCALLLLCVQIPAVQRAAAPFFGGTQAARAAAAPLIMGVLTGIARTYKTGGPVPAWSAADAVGWALLAAYLCAIALEASPRGRLWVGSAGIETVLGDVRSVAGVPEKATPSSSLRPGNRPLQPEARRGLLIKAIFVTTLSVISASALLLMVWLLYYLMALPAALQLPGVTSLAQAADNGVPALVENVSLRVLATLTAFAAVIVPGVNGSERWLAGSRVPRVAASWLMVFMLAVAAATGGTALPLPWIVAGTVAALSATNLSMAALVFWLFLHAMGYGGL